MTPKQFPPFPVALDFTDVRAYSVRTIALSEYAAIAEHQASEENEREQPNPHYVKDLLEGAEIAEQLIADVERQSEEEG